VPTLMTAYRRAGGAAVVVVSVLAMAASACGPSQAPETKVPLKQMSNVPQAAWDHVAALKMYFGHQSVGDNLVEGVREVAKDHPGIAIQIAKLGETPRFDGPGFLESKIGKNGDPATKTDRFAELVDGGLAVDGAVLFHKYCYGDFWDPEGPKVGEVFEHYKTTMARLRKDHPGVVFVHFTIPLGAPRLGFKTRVKKMLGGEIGEYRNNIRNDEFNELMRREYGGKEPLFDLARAEATRPDGTLETFTYRDRTYETLVPQFTNDDGHLNEQGRRQVAGQFLVFLAELSEPL
jgi:hypothetical protein